MNEETKIETFKVICKDNFQKIDLAYRILTTIDTKISNGIYTKSFIIAIYGILVESDIIPHKNLYAIEQWFFYFSIASLLVMAMLIIYSYHKMSLGRSFLSLLTKNNPEVEIIDLISVINKRTRNLHKIHVASVSVSILLVLFSSILFLMGAHATGGKSIFNRHPVYEHIQDQAKH